MAVRQKRRRVLAAAVVQGKPIAAVARSERISRSWASRETNSRETKLLIAELLDEHRAAVRKLVGRALKAIGGAFRAMDGKKPDHRVRLLAAKRVIELSMAGRRAGEIEAGGAGQFTWESFVTYYKAGT